VATLYFEMSADGEPHRRGILRLSFNDFLQKQLKSSTINGTPDSHQANLGAPGVLQVFRERAVRCVCRARHRADEAVLERDDGHQCLNIL
jgi:hypothetical protein